MLLLANLVVLVTTLGAGVRAADVNHGGVRQLEKDSPRILLMNRYESIPPCCMCKCYQGKQYCECDCDDCRIGDSDDPRLRLPRGKGGKGKGGKKGGSGSRDVSKGKKGKKSKGGGGGVDYDSSEDDKNLQPIGGKCFSGANCKYDRCFRGLVPPGEPGVCSCNTETNGGCKSEEEVCRFRPLVADAPPVCLLPVGERCYGDSECFTNHCFFGEADLDDPGVCACNTRANIGCEGDEEECRYPPFEADVPPECLLPIGASCEFDGQCYTDNCYFGFREPGSPGVCRCNHDTNAGCDSDEDEECQSPPFVADVGPGCLVPIGKSCRRDSNCISDNCVDGECRCNDFVDFGCDENEVCIGGSLDTPVCAEPGKFPVGARCEDSSECKTDVCWKARQNSGSPGVCVCDTDNDYGCSENRSCLYRPLYSDAPPVCLLQVGDDCDRDSDCYTDNCFEGHCQCHPFYNQDIGCDSSETCEGNDIDGWECV